MSDSHHKKEESHHDEGHHDKSHDEGHGHGHGHGHGPRMSPEEAKQASRPVTVGPANVSSYRLNLYKVTPTFRVVTGTAGRENFKYWNSSELKGDVLRCAKELNRFRYCEDNYSAEDKNPGETIEDEEYACTEEQWQATECLTGESPDTAEEIFAFANDVDNAAQLIRRLSSHIQIPREWQEVVQEVDPTGLTEPGRRGPESLICNTFTEKLTSSIMKTLFSYEIRDYTKSCSGDKGYRSKQCLRAQNALAQSWVALQSSRFNIRENDAHFSDVDTQKGNKIKKWKKANVVGGDKSLRRIEVHPADHWASTLQRKPSKYDWLPEITAAIEDSLNEGREEDPQGEEDQQ